MKENDARMLAKHGAIKSVVVEYCDKGARSTSTGNGWLVKINGETLRSARKNARVFATLDTAQDVLLYLGIRQFSVSVGGGLVVAEVETVGGESDDE